MDDYIKREDALEAIRKAPIAFLGTRLECEDLINDIPAADAVKRRHGRWIEERFLLYDGSVGYVLKCSFCDETFTETDVTIPPKEYPFCPACGASMENFWMKINN